MSQAVETLLMLCRCLAPARSGSEELPSTPDQWAAVIDLANHQALTPALCGALEERDPTNGLPEDAGDFLKEVCRLNRDRNLKIRRQAIELFGALNQEGITPLLLKGGIYLFDGNDAAVGTRMMVDLDILVDEPSMHTALNTADCLGYHASEAYNDWAHDVKCRPRPGDSASIEFHRFLGPQRTLLPPEIAMREASPLEFDSIRLLVPSLTHRVLHNIFHTQIQNRGHALGHLSLRDLHDLSLLLKTKGQEVDWRAIRTAMESHGYGRALASYLYAGERLFGLPVPQQIGHTTHSERHFRRSMQLVRSRRLRKLVSVWAALSHPFSRPLVEYLYGPSSSLGGLNMKRARHAYRIIRRHHLRGLSKVMEIRGLFYK